MSQLALFEGSHIPETAARDALERGDLREARDQLSRLAGNGRPQATDALRIERVLSVLGSARPGAVDAVHEAFASALAGSEGRGLLQDREWFVVYARTLVHELAGDPGRRFRGWLGAELAVACGETQSALRGAAEIVRELHPGPEWIAAARVEFAHGRPEDARAWVRAACLETTAELAPDPPALVSSGVPALDAAPSLPHLPEPIRNLFEVVDELEGLPGAKAPWIAVVGEIDRVLVPADEASEPDSMGEPDSAREFLAALRAARRSRGRDGRRRADCCSDRELRARRRMQRLAPALLERYIRGLGDSLF